MYLLVFTLINRTLGLKRAAPKVCVFSCWDKLRFRGETLSTVLIGSFCFYRLSWWSMMKHLTWSLLGIVELDPLDSVDNASVTLVHFLFGGFLLMGVIVLVNMMIALLSNTYQRVEVTSRNTCSFILFHYVDSVATCVREHIPTTLI